MVQKSTVFFLFIITLLTSCSNGKVDESEISDLPVAISFMRFEKDLFKYKFNNTPVDVAALRSDYTDFFELFTFRILNIPNADDSVISHNLDMFIRDNEISQIYTTVDSLYAVTNDLESDFSMFIKHFHYYFPERNIPRIVTYISAFNYAIVTSDSVIGLGLDMFLGDDYEFYNRLGIPKYMSAKFRKEYIVPAAVKGWFQSDYEQSDVPREFLNQMVYQGKMLYYIDKMIPDFPDTLKTGFSSEQLSWCADNESRIWSFFIEKKLLFSTDQSEYAKFINDGPNSHGFPKEAPAEIGTWIGLQIVRKYMDENREVTLHELLNESDALKILEKSKYKPQR